MKYNTAPVGFAINDPEIGHSVWVWLRNKTATLSFEVSFWSLGQSFDVGLGLFADEDGHMWYVMLHLGFVTFELSYFR